ncbi:MAG: cytochrome c biogenesis protein [Flavobacteriales bacterium]
MKFLKEHWWKILCVVCLIYVVIAGLITPLSPGIHKVEPSNLKVGANQDVLIKGYNTRFDGKAKPELWVEIGKDTICGRNIEVESEEKLRADLFIPKGLSHKSIVLHLSSPQSGTYLLPDAFFIQEGSGNAGPEKKPQCQPTAYPGPESFSFPFRKILYESIRNLYFHVPMWFGMMGLMTLGFVFSILRLHRGDPKSDRYALSFVEVGTVLALLGLATGSIWARFTWTTWWVWDPKLNGAAVTTLIYLAYLVLRNSIRDPEQRGRVAAVYNIFAFVLLIVFLLILPRVAPNSLHPGAGGNPAFSRYDLDNSMRTVFYPAVIGWFLLGLWIARLRIRSRRILEVLKRSEQL